MGKVLGMGLGGGFVELVLCDGALVVCCPESRFLRAAPRGVVAAARRGGVFAGGLQRVVLSAFCAARYAALTRGPRGAAAAFLASLMRR